MRERGERREKRKKEEKKKKSMDLVSRKNRVFSLAVLSESVCRSGGLISVLI